MTPASFIDAGDQVVAVGRTRGIARATGQSLDAAAVHVWTLTDREIAAFIAYVDHPAIRSALEFGDAVSI
jgi:ketosteroid isomerase-like protein